MKGKKVDKVLDVNSISESNDSGVMLSKCCCRCEELKQ